jgi:hypothetical protein
MTTRIFELTAFHIVYPSDKDGNYLPVTYPVFDLSPERLGLFTSLQTTEKGMQKYIHSLKQYYKDKHESLYCFLLDEYRTDELLYYCAETRRSYLPSGELLEECLTSEFFDETTNNYPPFWGRTPDKVRFHKGDIVEVEYPYGGHHIELGIVFAEPSSVEFVNRLIERYKQEYNNSSPMDTSDDCYIVLSDGNCQYAELTSANLYNFKPGDDPDFHGHPLCTQLFPPRLPIPDKLRDTLQAALRAYCEE